MGKPTDALVAELIFEWRWRKFKNGDKWYQDIYPPESPEYEWPDGEGAPPGVVNYDTCLHYSCHLPEYSTDMTTAWNVHLKAMDWPFSKRRIYLSELEKILREKKSTVYSISWPELLRWLDPDTICMAALRAHNETEERPSFDTRKRKEEKCQ